MTINNDGGIMKKTNRPEIEKITITFKDGAEEKIDPTNVSAIFFTKEHIDDILVRFYKAKKRKMTKEQVLKAFGKNAADAIFKDGSAEKIIDKDFIDIIWNTLRDNGKHHAYIMKDVNCPILGPDL